MEIRALARLVALALAASPETAPATPAGSVSEEIAVELVNVEVRAVDRDGHRVEGLTRDDFRVLEDGRPVAITHFAWVPPESAAGFGGSAHGATAPGAGMVSSPPRQFAIFFDELQLGDRSRAPLLGALYRSLSSGLAPEDRVSVVRFDGANLDVVLPWSTDRKKLARAFEDLGGFSANRLSAGLELRSWMRLLEQDIKGDAGRRGGGCPDAGVIVRSYADLVRRNVEYSASALLRYATRLAHEPGQRTLLHVSDGIPMIAGGEAYQYAIDMCGGEALAQGVPGAFSTLFDGSGDGDARDRFDPFKARLEMNEYVMASLWTDVTARINALGVTVYALQGSEIGTQFLPEAEIGVIPAASRAMAEQNPVDTLALMARETGGLLARGGRGVEEEVARLVNDLGGYYSIAFQPAPGSKPGLRKLEVEIDRPGVTLRHRQSYRLESRDERISAQLAELFEVDRVENPLALELGFREGAGAAEPRRLQVVVPFERLSLIPAAAGGEEGHFTIYVTIRKESGRVLVPRQRAIVARRADPKALAFTYEVALPEEKGEVAVAVVDDYSGTVAFAREKLRTR